MQEQQVGLGGICQCPSIGFGVHPLSLSGTGLWPRVENLLILAQHQHSILQELRVAYDFLILPTRTLNHLGERIQTLHRYGERAVRDLDTRQQLHRVRNEIIGVLLIVLIPEIVLQVQVVSLTKQLYNAECARDQPLLHFREFV